MIVNVPVWERMLRVVLGLGAGGAGLMMAGERGWLLLLITGATLALTGLVGFCPICRIAGRTPR